MKRNTYPGTKKRGQLWSFYLTVEGKKVWHSGFATQREAGEARTLAIAERNKGTYVKNRKISLTEYVHQYWLPSLTTQKPTTIHQYEQKIGYSLEEMGNKPIQSIRPVDIERFQSGLNARGLAPRTISMAVGALSMAFKHARDVGQVVSANPCEKVRKPKQARSAKSIRAMNRDQVKAILEVSEGTSWQAFIRLAFFTGARRGELAALRWSDINFENSTVTFSNNLVHTKGQLLEQSTKGGRSRTVSIDQDTAASLKAHRRRQLESRLELGAYWQGTDDDWVTVRPDGSQVTPNSAGSAWKRMCQKVGVVGFSLHDTRHTHATHLLAMSVPLHVVAARLGHHNPMVTATTYAHVLENQDHDASTAFAVAMQA